MQSALWLSSQLEVTSRVRRENTRGPPWLTRLDPATYGMDPLRRVVLGASLPPAVVDGMGLDLFGSVLPIPVEAAILMAFGAVMLWVAIRNFRVVA